MKRKRFSEEQIIAILREHEAGVATADLCRKHGMSNASLYAWKAKYGGMDVSEPRSSRGSRRRTEVGRPSSPTPGASMILPILVMSLRQVRRCGERRTATA
jgi:putative transposase